MALRRSIRCPKAGGHWSCVVLLAAAAACLFRLGSSGQQPQHSHRNVAFLPSPSTPARPVKDGQPVSSAKRRGCLERPRSGGRTACEAVETLPLTVSQREEDEKDILGELPDWTWRLVLLFLCMIWATNFAIIKEITVQPGVNTQLYAVCRFSVAAAAFVPFLLQMSSSSLLPRAVECGAWVAAGYIGQAIGLMTTSAAKSCFICSLQVVFVAFIIGITTRQVDKRTIAAAVLASVGVGFLELAGSQQFVIGDLISVAMPVCFGMAYIRLEEIMRDYPKDYLSVTAMKLVMVALASWGYYGITTGELPDFSAVLASPVAINGVLWTGLVTTAFGLLVETVAFRYIDATSASVIFTTEPLWGSLFAVWYINEPFSGADAVGGALVILACLVKEVPKSMLPWENDTKTEDDERQVASP